jgi:hypothetical protein
MRSVAFVHKVRCHEFQHHFSVGDWRINLVGTEKILVVQMFCEFLIIARELSGWKFKEAFEPEIFSHTRATLSVYVSFNYQSWKFTIFLWDS